VDEGTEEVASILKFAPPLAGRAFRAKGSAPVAGKLANGLHFRYDHTGSTGLALARGGQQRNMETPVHVPQEPAEAGAAVTLAFGYRAKYKPTRRRRRETESTAITETLSQVRVR